MTENSGWVKLHRCLLGKAIWKCSTPEQCKLFITILLLADHKPNQWMWKGEKYECQSGQFITSLQSLANTTGITIHQVRTALDKFEKLEFLTSEVSNKNRLITIVNWEFYQGYDEDMANNLANEWQTSGKQVATNKNVKNDKNNKELLDISRTIVSGNTEIYTEIVNYLNSKTGQHYMPKTKKTKDCINARLNEGFTVEDFKKVIDIKVADWGKDERMYQYLRPETLFGNKFESYLNQMPKPQARGKYQEEISEERKAEYDAIKL